MTIATGLGTVAAGLFAGAAVYVSVVEHPAWVECGPAIAIKAFGRSYRRAAAMQAPLAILGLLAGVAAWFQGAGVEWIVGGLLLSAMVPWTLIVIAPTNRRLLDPGLDSGSQEAVELLARWGRLHTVRTIAGVAAFILFVCRLPG